MPRNIQYDTPRKRKSRPRTKPCLLPHLFRRGRGALITITDHNLCIPIDLTESASHLQHNQDMDSTFALPSALSARSYLDLPHDIPSPEETSDPTTQSSEIGARPEESKSTPRFTSRAQGSMSRPEMSEMTPSKQDPPSPDRPRKRGRPRLETVKDAAAIEVIDPTRRPDTR